MRSIPWPLMFLSVCPLPGDRILERSDVVFMYQADRDTYADYGCDVVAWGGRPTSASLAQAEGLRFFGSVGMVTEFGAFFERFPEHYAEALCRDLEGNPIRIPWLTDHSHKGVPYFWCCTQQPRFQTFLKERVAETVSRGADGVHIDDHLGTAATLWHGGCFCDPCRAGFIAHLEGLDERRKESLSLDSLSTFDFQTLLQGWRQQPGHEERVPSDHPLWPEWVVYHHRQAAAFMAELQSVAEEVAGQPVPFGANAGLLWPRHLSDHHLLDLLSAETEHHAKERAMSDAPLFAYRLADAVGLPYASTASGPDWAFVKAHDLHALVKGWIALSYAAGHGLMAPHLQWCHTPEMGTHWYRGPSEVFAPLYRFIDENASLFDDHAPLADVGLVVPHASFVEDVERWVAIGAKLSAAHLGYRILLGGDRLVNARLSDEELASCSALLLTDPDRLQPHDRETLNAHLKRAVVFHEVEETVRALSPLVRVASPGAVRVFARVGPESVVIHLVNFQFEGGRDDFRPQSEIALTLAPPLLDRVKASGPVQLYQPGEPPMDLVMEDGRLVVPKLGLWAILRLDRRGDPEVSRSGSLEVSRSGGLEVLGS